jgi:hypothetical protein
MIVIERERKTSKQLAADSKEYMGLLDKMDMPNPTTYYFKTV